MFIDFVCIFRDTDVIRVNIYQLVPVKFVVCVLDYSVLRIEFKLQIYPISHHDTFAITG